MLVKTVLSSHDAESVLWFSQYVSKVEAEHEAPDMKRIKASLTSTLEICVRSKEFCPEMRLVERRIRDCIKLITEC